MTRYFWHANRAWTLHQLIDSTTQQAIATIEQVDDGWKWERKTSYSYHRAHPAKGTAETLLLAKIAVVKDLPDEVAT